MHEMKFAQSVEIEPFISTNKYHQNTYGTAITAPANVDYIKTVDSNGKVIITSAWVALPAGTTVTEKSRITLPDDSKQYISSFSPVTNHRTGETHYIEVYVSKEVSVSKTG